MPEGWAWCKLRDILTLIRNGATIKQSKDSKGLPITRIETISQGIIDRNKFGYADIFDEGLFKKFYLQNNDILMSHINSPIHLGKCAIYKQIKDDEKIIHGMNLLLLRFSYFVSPEFVMFVFKSSYFKEYVQMNMKEAVNQASISTKQISDCLIPMPPIVEQKQIVTEIEKFYQLIDTIENDKVNLQIAIKKAKSKILDLAIHGKLVPQEANDEPASVLLEKLRVEKEEKIAKGELKRDKNDSYIYKGSDNCYYQRFADGHEEDISEEIPCELPESWAWCRIKDICTINPKNKLDDNLEVSFIPMTLIDAGYTNHHGQEIRVWKKIKTGFTHFAENDVAIAKISPCFENKKSVILKNLKNGYGAGTTELYILRAYSIVLPEYLFWIVKTDSFINEGVGNFSGVVGQQRLARDIVENYYIPLPPINEQKRIISKIVSLFEKLDTIENNIE